MEIDTQLFKKAVLEAITATNYHAVEEILSHPKWPARSKLWEEVCEQVTSGNSGQAREKLQRLYQFDTQISDEVPGVQSGELSAAVRYTFMVQAQR